MTDEKIWTIDGNESGNPNNSHKIPSSVTPYTTNHAHPALWATQRLRNQKPATVTVFWGNFCISI